MKKLKQIIPLEFVLLIIIVLVMILCNGSKTKLILDANADFRSITFELEVPDTHWYVYDLDRLVRAIGLHETKDCTIGSGITHNNPGGVMAWTNGVRHFKYYSSCEEGYEDMKHIWSTYYKRFPDIHLARKYSGDDRAYHWLRNTIYFYNSLGNNIIYP